jgi:hypothetical protein
MRINALVSGKPDMDDLLKIQKLDCFEQEIIFPVPLKVLNNDKGRAVFLNSLDTIKTVAMLEFVPGAGLRANHYHHKRQESLYIMAGKLKLYYWLPHEPEIRHKIIESGHLVTILPGLGHAYEAYEHSCALEIGSRDFDPLDTVYDPRIPNNTNNLS